MRGEKVETGEVGKRQEIGRESKTRWELMTVYLRLQALKETYMRVGSIVRDVKGSCKPCVHVVKDSLKLGT